MFQPNPEYSRQIVRLSYLVACALIKHVYNDILFLKYATLKRATLGCFGSSELNDLLSEFEAKTLSSFHLRKVERFFAITIASSRRQRERIILISQLPEAWTTVSRHQESFMVQHFR